MVKLETILLSGACIISFIWIMVDIGTHQDLDDRNVSFAEGLQRGSTSGKDTFYEILSWLVDGSYIVPIILVIAYILPQRKFPSIRLIMYTVVANYIIASLKNIYITARPYQIVSTIQAKECSQDFGRPSGHAAAGLTLYLSLFFLFVMPIKQGSESRNLKIVKVLVGLFTVTVILLIGLSRVYNGVHTFGQVLLGWAYATIWMTFFFKFLDSKRVNQYLSNIINGINRTKALIFVTVFTIATFLITTIIYQARRGKVDYTTYYAAITSKCQGKEVKVDDSFLEGHFADTASISAVVGFLFVVFIIKKPTEPLPESISGLKRALRILIQIISAGGIIGAFSAISKNSNPYFNFFITEYIPFFLVGFVLQGALPHLFKAIGLSYRNDFLELECEDEKSFAVTEVGTVKPADNEAKESA